jgi:hypothetical protein
MNDLLGVVAVAIIVFLGVSHATAQETCLLYQRGTVDCPAYGAPAATAVPGPSMDGGVAMLPNGSSVTLFGGKVPPNGFMIRVYNPATGTQSMSCFINDNGPAGLGGGFYVPPDYVPAGQPVASATFATPHGYKPIGPVSIWCQTGNSGIYVAARGW